MVFTYVFHFTIGPHAWIQFLFTFTTFHVIFILSPTPFLHRFCLVFSSILSTEVEFKLYGIFSPCNFHVAMLGSNVFILSKFGKHPFSVLLRVFKSLFHHVVPSNVNSCNAFDFSHLSSSASQNNVSFCALLTS